MRPNHTEFKTLHDLLRRLPALGRQIAVVEYSAQSSGEQRRETTYQQLAQQIERVSSALTGKNISSKTSVMIWAPNSRAWIVVCLGAIKCGATVVPVDPQVDDRALKHIIEDSQAELLFTTTDQGERLKKAEFQLPEIVFIDNDDEAPDLRQDISIEKLTSSHCYDLEEIREGTRTEKGSKRTSLYYRCSPEDVVAIFYTSGTTGLPKGVPLTHGNFAAQVNALRNTRLIAQAKNVLLPLPLHHIYPFTCGLLTCMSRGATIVFPSQLTGPSLIDAMQKSNVTMIIGVPRLYSALLTAIERKAESQPLLKKYIFKALWSGSIAIEQGTGIRAGWLLMAGARKKIGGRLHTLASGGAALAPDTLLKLAGLGLRVAVGYGLTETSPILTLNESGLLKAGSAGKPIEGVEIKIASDTDEVLARGPGVFSGYYRLGELSRDAFTQDGWFRTGDTGRLDNDGYLYLRGRLSTMFKTAAGEKIQAEDLEEIFENSTTIKEIGLLMDREKLVALVVPQRPNRQSITQAGDIRDQLKNEIARVNARLASHQRISHFAISNAPLPRTRLGKIKRLELIEAYKEANEEKTSLAGKSSSPMPLSEMSEEDRLLLQDPKALSIWNSLTRRYHDAPLKPDTDLQLDLDIDSLEWLSLSLELKGELGIDLGAEDIREITTVRDLLERGRSAAENEARAIPLLQMFDHPEAALKPEQQQYLKPLRGFSLTLSGFLYSLNMILMRMLFKVSSEGIKNLPDQGAVIIAPNHVSYLDPFALAAVLPRGYLRQLHWAGWSGIMLANAWNRFIARMSQCIPIDPFSDITSSLALGAAVLKNNQALVWFPEGERSLTGELIPFKPGVALLAENLKVPILPVYIEGTYEALPPGKFIPRLNKITIKFGEIIRPEEVASQPGRAAAAPAIRVEQGQWQSKENAIIKALRQELEQLKSA